MSKHGYVPFNRAVPVPSAAPFEEPFVCLKFNREWLAYLLGAAASLESPNSWLGTPDEVDLAVRRAQDFRVQLMNETDCGQAENPQPNECNEYAPTAEFVDIAPSDPRTDPDFVPEGYQGPPFTIIDITNVIGLFIGLAVGDVITDLTRFPTGSLPTVIPPDGLARCRIHIKGRTDGAKITVRVTFVKFPSAGFVLVTQDDSLQPELIEYLDLNRRILSVPPETTNEVMIERSFLGSGEHHIDCTFFPRISVDEPPFLFYGGGIRRIEICGLEDECGNCPECPDPECPPNALCGDGSIGDEMGLIRWNTDECKFEQSADGENWCEIWPGIMDCVQGLIDSSGGNPGNSGEGEIPLGECRTYKFKLDGSGQWKAPVPIRKGYTIKTDILDGAGFDGANWYCPNGQGYILGGCFGSGVAAGGSDPAQDLHHMVIAGFFTNYSAHYELATAETTAYTVPDAVSVYTDFIVKWNDSSPSDNSGETTIQLTICHNSDTGTTAPIQLLTVAQELNLTITTILAGRKWHIHAPYNNSPTGGGQPVTVAQVLLIANGDNVGAKWLIDNVTGWADTANYTNNGAIYTSQWLSGAVNVPHPITGGQSWSQWFNTNYGTTTIYAIDMRSTVASTALEFDVIITP